MKQLKTQQLPTAEPAFLKGVDNRYIKDAISTDLITKLNKEIKSGIVYPTNAALMRAFRECPWEKLKVVILGQDPYHDGSATGLCFDNKKEGKISPSLRNILKKISDETGSRKPYLNSISYLEHLPKQGVLLLNTALTVRQAQANSHSAIWQKFTDKVIDNLNEKENLVWILWGNPSRKYKDVINKNHFIIEGAHPSPLARGKFFESDYFNTANTYLDDNNLGAINW